MFKSVFSFEGRIRRLEYGITFLLVALYSALVKIIIISIMSADGYNTTTIEYIPLYLLFISFAVSIGCAQGAKRCHDFNISGWWQLIPFFPLYMLFRTGDIGDNQYGSDPKVLTDKNSATMKNPYTKIASEKDASPKHLLDKLLDDNAITPEQYSEKLKAIQDKEVEDKKVKEEERLISIINSRLATERVTLDKSLKAGLLNIEEHDESINNLYQRIAEQVRESEDSLQAHEKICLNNKETGGKYNVDDKTYVHILLFLAFITIVGFSVAVYYNHERAGGTYQKSSIDSGSSKEYVAPPSERSISDSAKFTDPYEVHPSYLQVVAPADQAASPERISSYDDSESTQIQANSVTGDDTIYKNVKLNYGISVDIPAHWEFASINNIRALNEKVASIAENVEYENSKGTSETLIAVNAMPKPVGGKFLIDVFTPSPFTESDLYSAKNDDLEAVREEYIKRFNTMLGKNGRLKIIAAQRFYLGWIANSPALVMPYTRTSMNEQDTWHVTQYKIPKSNHLIEITMSYRDRDSLIWKPIMARIYKSIKIE